MKNNATITNYKGLVLWNFFSFKINKITDKYCEKGIIEILFMKNQLIVGISKTCFHYILYIKYKRLYECVYLINDIYNTLNHTESNDWFSE